MPKIGRFPAFGKRFFKRIRKLLGGGAYAHFWRLAMALAATHSRRNLKGLHEASGSGCTRQALSYFLEHAAWEAPEVLAQTAVDTLARLGYKPGQKLYAIFDDTQKRKRGKVMAALHKIFLHAEKVYATGHTIAACCLVYRGVIIPCAVRLWASEEFCQQSQQERHEYERVTFVKLTKIVGEMVRDLALPKGADPIVLFDSYYFCPAVVNSCKARGWAFVSVAKKNRSFRPYSRRGEKWKLGKCGRNILQRWGKWQRVGGRPHRVVEKVGEMSKVGRVKVVFSQRRGETNWIAVVTDRVDWDAVTVLNHYRTRWPIELLFKMSKQHLGLGDYQVLGYRGVVRYLHLVMIAYLLLTHLALDEPDAQAALQGTDALRLPSIPQLQQLLRRKLWEDTIDKHATSQRQKDFAQKLQSLLIF
jgi:SRSO17 transposase